MTSSAVDPNRLQEERRRVFLALFSALAIVLHTVEFLLPSPIPWFRLGFANIVALFALYTFDWRAAWSVTLVRILVGSLFLGTFLSPRFALSLAGGLLAVAAMTVAHRTLSPRIGPVGVSIIGASGHVCGQMFCAWLLLVKHGGLWHLLPTFLAVSALAGLVNGVVVAILLERIGDHPAFSGRLRENTPVD